jgi:hypothetical protein
VADADGAGVELLPVAGEIGPRCSCPDWADPCKHAAAVIYLVSDVLDADPFALFLLRGRTREEVLAALRLRRAASSTRRVAAESTDPDRGVVAREAFARTPARLPAAPLPPRHAGNPVPIPVGPPVESGVRSQDLADLAADAAGRAWELSVGEGDGGLRLDPRLDLVRRVASSGRGEPDRLFQPTASRAGIRPADLGRLAAAWRLGGAEAVAVLEELWFPDADVIEEGRAALSSAGTVSVRGNRVTLTRHGLQLRVARSGVWYRFERTGRGWTIVAGPAADPARVNALRNPANV